MTVDSQAVRAALEEKLSGLMARAVRLDDSLHNRHREVPQDSQEQAQFRENDEVIEALDEHTRRRILEIRATLGRIDAGTWEKCGGCGKAIEPGRLKALPTTTRCKACAASAG